eukprot:184776-Chlamydomonas_euryale.AAC.2
MKPRMEQHVVHRHVVHKWCPPTTLHSSTGRPDGGPGGQAHGGGLPQVAATLPPPHSHPPTPPTQDDLMVGLEVRSMAVDYHKLQQRSLPLTHTPNLPHRTT